MCIATLPILPRKIEEDDRQFRLPGGMAIPVMGILLSVWLLTHASWQSWLATGGFMLLGSILYFFTARKAKN